MQKADCTAEPVCWGELEGDNDTWVCQPMEGADNHHEADHDVERQPT
jgi:hypothetical protein